MSLLELDAAAYDWERFFARPEQLPPPGDWYVWLFLAGRGSGKSRASAEWIRRQAELGRGPMALVGRTAADVRDVMIEGSGGLMSVCPPWWRPKYEPSKRRLTFPNGVIATAYSAEEGDALRGPSHAVAWCDELASWKYWNAWDMLMMTLRVGDNPQCVVSTTPRPLAALRKLSTQPGVVVTRGTTYDNADNLAPGFMDAIIAKYAGTTLGRQELLAEMLSEIPGALWRRKDIDDHRVDAAPDLVRVVVGVDPSVTSGSDSDECGVVAVGKSYAGHYYVLKDWSGVMSPDTWARRAVTLYQELRADRVVAEVNQGGDLVGRLIYSIDDTTAYTAVHASKGKRARAEPVAALYERGLVHHQGIHTHLEDQLCNFVPGQSDGSPDRLDAMVWAFTELMEHDSPAVAPAYDDTGASRWRV
jgi:phage terminase large subunit-like protein